MPQSVKLPLAIVADPDFKAGANYYPDQSDNFFVGNSFPTCGINFTRAGNHGPVEGEPVRLAAGVERRRRAAPSRRCARANPDAGTWDATECSTARSRMEGVSKRYGGVRALDDASLAVARGPHPRHSRRERRRQIDADQDHGRRGRAGRRAACELDGREVAFARLRPRPIAPASSASSRNCR